jgi:hypothetical protein
MTRTVTPDRTIPAPGPGHVSDAPIEPVAVADRHLRLSRGERTLLAAVGHCPVVVAGRPG